uniref:DNA oxidative demethylase ALKBH2 n=1 Tax=Timema bartmani TaxID=61472 RepID=A0A7R9F0P1_9NEOP|nr:unnamed protein product [Timema bartmani]
MEEELAELGKTVAWEKFSAEGLDMDYTILLPASLASKILLCLERDVQYFSGNNAQVKVFGKWHAIPRQQVAFGDPGLFYTFSGNTIPAVSWPPVLIQIRDMLHKITGHYYNFVLVNRYRNGDDHIGEHRDNERGLDPASPIASLSLGQAREFVLRHGAVRKKIRDKRDIPPVKVLLQHGSLLMMNPPTNQIWYHSLPPRKSCPGVRINLTFRKLLQNS